MGRARRQYDAVDPDNRLVAAELEKRWNDRLAVVRNLETELEGLTASPAVDLTPADRERLMTLGADLERAWSSAGVAPETRKRIVRTLIDEIVVRVEDNALDLVIRWHGGDHSALKVKKNRSGQHRWSAAGETVDLVRVLARQMPDKAIASVLNRSGKTRGAAMAGPSRECAACAATTTSQPIAKASAATAARPLWTRLRRPSPSANQPCDV
ncbi:hypothetical protein ACVW1C_005812 [Bradyrhizobium sp. USDA 4011]